MPNHTYLGQDLDLGFVANEEGRVFAGRYSYVDLQAIRREDVWPRATDLGLVGGMANLVQSLILRLKTERGELAALGHPEYGSRHHQLIGEPNTEGNRNLVKLYVLECLRQEPRIAAIQRLDVHLAPGRENRDKVVIEALLSIKGFSDPLSLVIPFSFEGPLE
ncbi:MAG TPA: hypothetical protein VFU22_08020 [Roseiflexaceae bacterium]|nr:hypothetical protein [Roseiflexaceae bacterium]